MSGEANQVAMNGSGNQSMSRQVPLNQVNQSGAQAPSQVQNVAGQMESVTVTADAAPVELQPAANQHVANLPVAGRQTLPMAATAPPAGAPAAPAVKWSALRRQPDGRLSPVEPDRIRADDAIVLRLEPYADGTLWVAESVAGVAAPRVLLPGMRVKRAQPVDTPAVTLDHPGVQTLLVRFTALAAAKPGAIAAAAKRPDAAQPAQTITLRYR